MGYRQRLTNAGRDVIAKGQTGLLITFTRIELGQGEMAWEDIPQAGQLIDPVMNSPISAIAHTALGQVTITTKIPLRLIPRDFFLNEIGVFARVGGEPETLYGVSIADGPTVGITQEMGGGSTAEHTVSVAVVIGEAEHVTAVFDPDISIINIGTVGSGWFANRVGNEFRFKRIVPTEPLRVTDDGSAVFLSLDAPIPAGGMIPFAGLASAVPAGWLVCDGAWYPKAEFPALAAAIGNLYGGDTVHFAVPDSRDRTCIGASAARPTATAGGALTHSLTEAQLASHSHFVIQAPHAHSLWEGGGHSHNLIDPGHGHWSPPHNTGMSRYQMTSTNAGGGAGFDLIGRATGVNFYDHIYPDAAGVTIAAAGTGIWMQAAATGAQVQGANANVSIQNTGNGQAFSLMQPFLAINYIIRT